MQDNENAFKDLKANHDQVTEYAMQMTQTTGLLKDKIRALVGNLKKEKEKASKQLQLHEWSDKVKTKLSQENMCSM